jgi:hypothetical protein
MSQASLKERLSRVPIAFPLIALFHLVWIIIRLAQFSDEPFPDPVWTQMLWLVAYTAAWFVATGGRKLGANLYILLIVLNLVLRFAIKDPGMLSAYTDALFPIDVLCGFILLVFYKKLR